jgi:hypothetical protein
VIFINGDDASVSPDEIVSQLALWNVTLSRPTLLRYQTQGLISEPQRGSAGRGIGKWTKYSEMALKQAYAAWCLLHGEYGNPELQIFFQGKPPNLRPECVASIKKRYFKKDDETTYDLGGPKLETLQALMMFDSYEQIYRDLIQKTETFLK